MSTSRLPSQFERCIPNDHSRQMTAEALVRRIVGGEKRIGTVLDLGCGVGDSIDLFRTLHRDISWIGLDVEDSPEVRDRIRADGDFRSYDGANIPLDDAGVDLVYSRQVFEHVRHPEPLLREVARVLRPGYFFVGSTSHLEPYHSLSFWNYTPSGFCTLLRAAGLEPLEVRPSIDAITLIARRLLGRPRFFKRWWERESPGNRTIELISRLSGNPTTRINIKKLQFCGQFSFVARKPQSGAPS